MQEQLDKNWEIIGEELKVPIYGGFISLAIIVAGIVISIYMEDWAWFARFGSLIVVVGIVVALKDIQMSIQKIEPNLLLGFNELIIENNEEYRKNAIQRFLKSFNKEVLKLDKSKLTKELNNEINKRKQLGIKQIQKDVFDEGLNDYGSPIHNEAKQLYLKGMTSIFRISEATILIVGTIIWGFGDLFGSCCIPCANV